MEVADSTYPDDAGEYLEVYAEAGIPLYWIVNILSRRIEVYSGPSQAGDGTWGYASRNDYTLDQQVPVTVFDGDSVVPIAGIPVIDILRDSLEPDTEGAGA